MLWFLVRARRSLAPPKKGNPSLAAAPLAIFRQAPNETEEVVSIAGFLIFLKSIAARETWYWATHHDAGKVSSRLAGANKKTNETKIERHLS
jgi:hypothetical protein